MRVDLLCSGSKGNACLVRENDTAILIDCGPTTWKYLSNSIKEAGMSCGDLDALLITHSHVDHIRQLRHFSFLPVYTCCPLKAKTWKGDPVALDLRTITPPARFTVGDLRILALPTSHDSGPSMGFVIEGETEKLVYMTDTGYVPEHLIGDLRDADYYVFESNHDLEKLNQTDRPFWLKMRIASDTGHLCNQDSARILSQCITDRTRRIVLAHLSEEANTPQLALHTLFERLEYSHVDREHLVIQAAGQFEPLHFGSVRSSKPEESSDDTASVQPALYDLQNPGLTSGQPDRLQEQNEPRLPADAASSALPALPALPSKAGSSASSGHHPAHH